MKKIIAFFCFLIIGVSISFSNPTIPPKLESIAKQMTYPESAKLNNEEGIVLVSFSIDNIGKICIREINSNNETLRDYVIGKLSQIFLPENTSEETFCLKFEFKIL